VLRLFEPHCVCFYIIVSSPLLPNLPTVKLVPIPLCREPSPTPYAQFSALSTYHATLFPCLDFSLLALPNFSNRRFFARLYPHVGATQCSDLTISITRIVQSLKTASHSNKAIVAPLLDPSHLFELLHQPPFWGIARCYREPHVLTSGASHPTIGSPTSIGAIHRFISTSNCTQSGQPLLPCRSRERTASRDLRRNEISTSFQIVLHGQSS
jgi:hypothetical protein